MRTRNPAERRYQRRVIAASLAYAGTLMGEEYLIRHMPLPDAVKFALALLPALSIVAVFAALGYYLIEERDEYLRARTIRQILWGTGLSLSALTFWGFPEDAGLLPHLPTYFAAVFWFAGFGIAGFLIKALDR
ncbi:hypothetical protein FHS31_000721 [Sphingomonas vulcanisoli]|uniref:Uncharacterized protein n=1 Tax=Sphingomonas vulcanisoli TaxID=1658060 RepID=A0ABX0TQY3_9SPHN|nr:hypothetical protein [Sphingomonas vulcanisoli]NIJ07139.1 hypothetical protein [Sphingomonas vulcanisoli]